MTTKPTPWWKEPTRAQWAAFFAAWFGWVLDAFDFTIFICVTGAIMKEFGQTAAAVAGSLTLTLVVRLAGGVVAGWMADRWGRKLPLMLSLLWFAVFDAAIYFAPSFAWLLVLRTLFGFGMGAEWTAGTALAMENFPERGRKFASGLLQAGWPVGFLAAAAVAHFIVPAYGWRAMFLVAAVPALLVIPIRFLVPDEMTKVKSHTASRGAIADLTAPGVLSMIVLGSLVMALGFVVYYGMSTSSMGLHFEAAACAKGDAACFGAAQAAGWTDLMWFNAGMLVGVIVAGRVAQRFGIIVALITPALLMVPALPLFVGAAPGLMSIGAVLGGALGVGYSGVTPVLTTSLFPDHVRARAIGIVYHTGALLAAFIPPAIPKLAEAAHISLATTVELVVGGGLVAMSACVWLLRNRIAPVATPRPAPLSVEAVPAAATELAPVAAMAPARDSRSALHA